MTKKQDNRYDASTIQVLEDLEPVRRRPAMYIGDTGADGYHHLLTEIVNNSIDEALADFCDQIWVDIHTDESVIVIDNGRGIPIDTMDRYNKSALEIIMTRLHAGGKFGGEGYKISGGLHGVGLSVVNALSETCTVQVKRNGKIHQQEYRKGEPQTGLEIIDEEESLFTAAGEPIETGTAVKFEPDQEIFGEQNFSYKRIKNQFRNFCYLTAGLAINLRDRRQHENIPPYFTFYFEGGLRSFVHYLNRSRKVLQDQIFYSQGERNDIWVETAFQYHEDVTTTILTFANNIETTAGGTHEIGFKIALTRSINDYARRKGILKESDSNFSGEDVREGLTAAISVKMNAQEVQFEGQTKAKLGNKEVRSTVERVLSESLDTFLEENPSVAENILKKIDLAKQARVAAKKARQTVLRKSVLESASLPGKLADCQSRDASRAELYVVEGDSAGGSAKQARDREFQAVLPLSGKPINAEKNRLVRVLKNEKLRDLLTALGCGVGEEFNIENLRYHHIILMNDADVDGAHITTLVLTFLYRQLKPLIEEGYVYIAQPPFFRIKAGKSTQYVYTEAEKNREVKKLKKKNRSFTVQRFKGLGEMNPSQLWETTMNPETRILKKVILEDAAEADHTFTMLMGEQVPPRKRFIQANANKAELDV